MESFRILHADPDPGATATLAAAAQVDHRSSAADAGEVMAAPLGVLKAEQLHIEMQTGLHILHAQDGLAVFKVDGNWSGMRHGKPPLKDCRSIPDRSGKAEKISPLIDTDKH